MIYDKLPILFLTYIASHDIESTNSIIGNYILDNIDDLSDIGIKELANRCHVGVGTVSRFCKEIGLNSFVELKEILNTCNYQFQTMKQNTDNPINNYESLINSSLELVSKTVDIKQINKLCRDLNNYHKIGVFGLLKAGGVALNLQSDLLMLGKKVYSNISFNQQVNYLKNSNKDTLIIIFSYTGSYFDYQELRFLRKHLINPKIWMITTKKESYESFIDEIIEFDSLRDQLSHPYQLQFIAGLIAQQYAKTKKLDKN